MLLALTLITAALVVLALAGYLIAIAWALLDTRRSVAAIADGLEAVAGHTAPLPEKLTTINGALGALLGGLRGGGPPCRARGPRLRPVLSRETPEPCASRTCRSSSTPQGKPYLRAGVADPYAADDRRRRAGAPTQLTADRIEELLRRNGYIKDLDFDPVTRVAGALAFHTVADFQDRKVLEARSVATLFRGYEVIMIGRDPRDAIFITSRACGVCGGVHSVTSAMAIEMAIGCVPPPLGILIRNLALALEFLYDHPLHLHLLAGPDYSAAMVGPTNPSLLDRARAAREAPHADDPRLPDDVRPHGGPEPAQRQALPRGAAHDAGRARGLRADLRQVPASADHRARRHELDDHADA